MTPRVLYHILLVLCKIGSDADSCYQHQYTFIEETDTYPTIEACAREANLRARELVERSYWPAILRSASCKPIEIDWDID